MSTRRSSLAATLSFVLILILSAALPSVLSAQAGRIVGTVTDSAKFPLVGAQVMIPNTRMRAVTDEGGHYTIGGVNAGTYDIRVQRIGQLSQTVSGIQVRSGEDSRVDVVLPQAALTLGGMVVSASRRPEKITDAPATITRIDASAI